MLFQGRAISIFLLLLFSMMIFESGGASEAKREESRETKTPTIIIGHGNTILVTKTGVDEELVIDWFNNIFSMKNGVKLPKERVNNNKHNIVFRKDNIAGYQIQFKKKTGGMYVILLTASTDKNLRLAAYDLLEQMGYFLVTGFNEPAVDWAIDERLSKVIIKNKVVVPHFDSIRTPYDGVSPEIVNTVNYGLTPSHGFVITLKPEIYYPLHPDWFYLNSSLRSSGKPPNRKNATSWQLRLKNTSLRAEYAKLLIDYHKRSLKDPRKEIHLSLGISDSFDWDPKEVAEAGSIEKYYWDFVNDVMSRIRKQGYNFKVTVMAYHEFQDAPDMEIDPNIVPFITLDQYAIVDDAIWSAFKARVLAWKAKGLELGVWDYQLENAGDYASGRISRFVPRMVLAKVQQAYQWLAENNVKHLFIENEGDYWGYGGDKNKKTSFTHGYKRYVENRLFLNPYMDLEAAKNLWYKKVAGGAWQEMKQFWEFWEDYYKKFTELGYLQWGGRDAVYYRIMSKYELNLLSSDDVTKVNKIWDSLLSKLQGKPELSRVLKIKKNSWDDIVALLASPTPQPLVLIQADSSISGQDTITYPVSWEKYYVYPRKLAINISDHISLSGFRKDNRIQLLANFHSDTDKTVSGYFRHKLGKFKGFRRYVVEMELSKSKSFYAFLKRGKEQSETAIFTESGDTKIRFTLYAKKDVNTDKELTLFLGFNTKSPIKYNAIHQVSIKSIKVYGGK